MSALPNNPRKAPLMPNSWAGRGVFGQAGGDSLRKKFTLEEIDNLRNIAYAGEHGGNNLNSVASSASFSDKYLNLRASLHVHFVLRTKGKTGDIDTRYLCSILQRSPEIIDGHIDGFGGVERVSQVSCPEMLSNNDEEAMLVEDVEFRNYPEIVGGGFFPRNIRSIIRLQLLDSCECFRRKQRLNGLLEFREIRLADTDREVSSVTAGNVIAVENCQLANQMVESGAQIVNYISDLKRPEGIVRSYFPVPKNYALPFRVIIDGERVITVFRSSPLIQAELKLTEMVICSTDLMPDSDEICAHS
jgi:hypothetical protein